MGKNGINRKNTVIDPQSPLDLATSISKYTSGGVMLTGAISELAKSLVILFQDQMGYTTFSKRHGSCMFDLYRECFYYVGHDIHTGHPLKHRIHEWQTAGDFFAVGDCESVVTATRTEIRVFAKDLPGFLEKLRDDLTSSAAESEGKAFSIGALANALGGCNLIILERQKDRPEPGSGCAPEFVIRLIRPHNVEAEVVPLCDTGIEAINVIDRANEDLLSESHEAMTERHSQYAVVLRSQLRQAYTQGVDQGSRAQAIHDRDQAAAAEVVQDEDEVIDGYVESIIAAICEIDGDDAVEYPGMDRRAKYTEAILRNVRMVFRLAHRQGLDQGMAADTRGGYMEIPVYEDKDRAAFKGPVPVEGIRFFSSDRNGNERRCVEKGCSDILDLFLIKVLGEPAAVIGLCSKAHTYLYLPSDYPITEDIRRP